MLELCEDLRLAHRRAEDHGRARTFELGRQDLRVANGHARRGEGHRRAPAHPSLLAVGQVVACVEVFDLTRISRPSGDASNDATGEIPFAPDSSPPKNASRPSPIELTTPMPVTKTRDDTNAPI